MQKIVLSCLLSVAATALITPDPADAARRTRQVIVGAPVRVVVRADSYYYRGPGTQGLYDQARPFFGSPVRGYEFFRFNADRSTQ